MKSNPAQALIDALVAMHADGTPLMQRVLPADTEPEQWAHYPPDDAVSPATRSRYFYHCHPPEDRDADEHGHFHLFLPLSLFDESDCKSAPPDDGEKRAQVVHLIAISIDRQGLPLRLFTTNRWVADEWLFSADSIARHIDQFDLEGADGDPLVNGWLTACVALSRAAILALLDKRDAVLMAKNWPGEDRSLEVVSSAELDLQTILDAALA